MRWFGPPWNSTVCNLGEQVDVPVSRSCGGCQELIKEGEQGVMVAEIIRWEGDNAICREVPYHQACILTHIRAEMAKFLSAITPRKKKPKPKLEPEPTAEATCEHDWWCYSTAVADPPKILVQCSKCRVLGSTQHFIQTEWNRAWSAPSQPFRWTGPIETVVNRPVDLAEGIPPGGQNE